MKDIRVTPFPEGEERIKSRINKVTANRGLRVCKVDGTLALFHRWIDEDETVLKINNYLLVSDQDAQKIYMRFKETNVATRECDVNVMRRTFALVEYEDGSVSKVDPEKVKFINSPGC